MGRRYRLPARRRLTRTETAGAVGVGAILVFALAGVVAGIAAEGFRVLLADLDAQGSASLSLGLTRADLQPGAAEVLLEGRPIREAIRKSSVAGLDILPGSMALASADLALSDIHGREAVLKVALKPIRSGTYDYVILDCPPSLGLLTVNALTAADFFLVPLTPDYLSLEGLVNLLEAVERIRAGIGTVAAPLGILLTLADARLNVTAEISGMIREHYGRLVCRTVIPGNVRLKEAPSFGKTIFDYDAGSAGAEAYRHLAKEILNRMGKE